MAEFPASSSGSFERRPTGTGIPAQRPRTMTDFPVSSSGSFERKATGTNLPAQRPPERKVTGAIPAQRTSTSTGVPIAGVSQRPSSPSLPRTTTGQMPRVTGELPRTTSSPSNPQGRPLTGLPVRLGTAATPEEARQRMAQTSFEDDEPTHYDRLLGARPRAQPEEEDDVQPTAVNQLFDGEKPARGVTVRDLIAVNAPLQSREDRRAPKITLLIIDQFAVGANPRYDPDDGRPRGHIFVWDFTRAMNAEIPHFFGTRELSLAQTCTWIRQEGPGHGWFRASLDRASEALEVGAPVVLMPRDVKIAQLAVARPGEFAADGKPLVTAVALKRGRKLEVRAALGASIVDYYIHA